MTQAQWAIIVGQPTRRIGVVGWICFECGQECALGEEHKAAYGVPDLPAFARNAAQRKGVPGAFGVVHVRCVALPGWRVEPLLFPPVESKPIVRK